MATQGKKLLLVSGFAFTMLMLFGSKKYNTAKEVLGKIKFRLKNVSNFKFDLPKISFDADIELINPTNIEFGATVSSKIAIKRIRVYTKGGLFIGNANTNLFEVFLPANSSYSLPTTTVDLEGLNALNEFMANSGAYLDNDFSNLVLKIDIEAFGNIITIDAGQN